MNDRVLAVVYKGIDEVNQLLPAEARVFKTLDTELIGRSGALDSVGLVNLIVAIEQEVQREFDVVLDLADTDGLSLRNNPFSTVKTLADYVAQLLER